MNRDAPLLFAFALLSAALTAQQVALMQVLGWMHWHHFAYLVVAVALLGFGLAGTVLSLARSALLARWRSLLDWLSLGTAIAIPVGLRLAQLDALSVDLPLVFFDPLKNGWRLLALCLLLLPPFFCGGLATGLILTANARQAGRTYAASLAGAGLGGLLGLAFVATLAPPLLPAATASLALLAALSLRATRSATDDQRPRPLRRHAATLLTVSVVGAAWFWPAGLTASQFKPIRRTLALPDARIVTSRPSVHGWIQIVDAPALRPAPGVSLDYRGEIPRQRAVFVNGLGYGSLLDATATRSPAWLDHTPDAAAFLFSPRKVALLETGPGGWAAFAAVRGASRIAVVEPNRTLVNLLTTSPAASAPEWSIPQAERITASGRAFLRHAGARYDLVRFPSVGALGGSAGLTSTSEQFLLTREAFADALRTLTSDGVIAVTAWMDFPERNPLRLLATLVEAAESSGRAPATHIVALRSWAAVTFLLGSAPWTREQLVALRAFCRERGFDPLLLPDLAPDEREQHHAWQNPAFFTVVDRLVSRDRAALYRSYPFFLSPASDNRPYFSQFLRWADLRNLRRIFGASTLPFFELGSLTVALTLLILLSLGAAGIVLPLLRLGWHNPHKASVLLYFAGLGAGFMLIEIALMLVAHAWLGSPVIAAAVVLTTLLIASGAGSLWSERHPATARHQLGTIAAIVVATLAAGVSLAWLGPIARGWPLALQLAALLSIATPLGVVMGMAFPLGLRRTEAAAPAHVPWAWAINGCVSVATPAAAMLLAMSAGFSALFVAAALAYALALLGSLVGK